MQLFLALAALAGAALALPAADPAPPALTYLFTANLTVSKPISVGAGPQGSRQVVPITGGVFAGPKLSGKIAAAGGDWGLTDAKGAFSPEALYVLELADGAGTVLVTGKGRVPHETVLFETGSEKFAWLNKVVAVGRAQQAGGGLTIDVFQVG